MKKGSTLTTPTQLPILISHDRWERANAAWYSSCHHLGIQKNDKLSGGNSIKKDTRQDT